MCSDALELDSLIKALYGAKDYAERTYGSNNTYFVEIHDIVRYSYLHVIGIGIYNQERHFLTYVEYICDTLAL